MKEHFTRNDKLYVKINEKLYERTILAVTNVGLFLSGDKFIFYTDLENYEWAIE